MDCDSDIEVENTGLGSTINWKCDENNIQISDWLNEYLGRKFVQNVNSISIPIQISIEILEYGLTSVFLSEWISGCGYGHLSD
jgi:hypothetical protein